MIIYKNIYIFILKNSNSSFLYDPFKSQNSKIKFLIAHKILKLPR